jgi:hypothetical protein
MGHCVGGYHQAVQRGDSLIYSLRDPSGQPHVTTEIEPIMDPEYYNSQPGIDLPPRPHGGNVIQIQGKGNQRPIPEYQEKMKNWFHTFSPEDRPRWEEEREYPLDNPQDIESHHFSPHGQEDEYGLIRPHDPVDWPGMMHNMVNDTHYRDVYHSPQWAHDAYQLANTRGEIPQMAAALGNWQDKVAEPAIDKLHEQNWESQPNYDPDDPNFDEKEYDAQQEAYEEELAHYSPHQQALTNLYGYLQPHYDYSTQSYQNVPTVQNRPGTFSSWDFNSVT